MEATSQGSSRPSPSESPEAWSVAPVSQEEGAQALHKAKSIDIEKDVSVTTRQQIPYTTDQSEKPQPGDTQPPSFSHTSEPNGHRFESNNVHDSIMIMGSIDMETVEKLLKSKRAERNRKAAKTSLTSFDTETVENGDPSRHTQVRDRSETTASGGQSTGRGRGRSESDDGEIQGKPLIDQSESSILGPNWRDGGRHGPMFQDPLPPRLDEIERPRPEKQENIDIMAKGLPHLEVPTTESDSTRKSSLNISDMTLDLPQGADDDEMIPKHREELQTNLTLNTEPEFQLYRNIDEDAECDEVNNGNDSDPSVDGTTSVQSYADSILGADSAASSASSVYSDTQALVGEYADFLVRDPGLEKLFMRSMLPTVLGPERFMRKYSRILKSYARDLMRHPSTSSHLGLALRTQGLAFISRRSITIRTASIIASRCVEKAPRAHFRPGRAEDENAEIRDGNETSGDESPVDESVHTFMISELGQYFRGAPFQRMKRNLRNLVIPNTLLSRVKASAERILDLVLGDDYLRFLLFKALSDPLVPVRGDQFDPETEIRYFGSRLRAEANSPDHLRIAEFIETYAGYIGTRAAQRMEGTNIEAILQESRASTLPKFDARNGCKIIIEDKRGQQQLQSPIERQTSPTSKLRRAMSQVRRGVYDTLRLMLFNMLLLYTCGKVLEDSADQLDQHPIARSIAIFILVYLFVEELNTAIATLLWRCSTASKERGEPDTEALRYFSSTWSIGDGDDLEKRLHSHIWKPYNAYLTSTSEEVLETIIDDNLPNLCDADIDTHWPFVASSRIFEEYVDRVRDAAIPTFFSQAKKLVVEGLVGDEDPDAAAGKTNLLGALVELQWCFMQSGMAPTIHISGGKPGVESFHVSNLLKLAVEASSRSQWQWWPLQPPKSRGKARSTECRISWKCQRGPERSPIALNNSSSQATGKTSGSGAHSADLGASSISGGSSLRSSTAATSPNSSVISLGSPSKAFVFLLVKAARYTLSSIDVTEKTSRDFFQAIVENYNQKRGWRRLLSIYVYSHCDFVKIERYAPRRFDPGPIFSFPPHDKSPHSKEYIYYPRPMTTAPVTKHLFNDLFYTCYSNKGLAHKLHHIFNAPGCIVGNTAGKLLDKMPKRDRMVDEDAVFSEDQDVEVFWGLVAREQQSKSRVVTYMLLGLGPSFWFMFQWLSVWGHDGDLQNATVPLMFSATILGIVWAVAYSGDNMREVEQLR